MKELREIKSNVVLLNSGHTRRLKTMHTNRYSVSRSPSIILDKLRRGGTLPFAFLSRKIEGPLLTA